VQLKGVNLGFAMEMASTQDLHYEWRQHNVHNTNGVNVGFAMFKTMSS